MHLSSISTSNQSATGTHEDTTHRKPGEKLKALNTKVTGATALLRKCKGRQNVFSTTHPNQSRELLKAQV